jgi:hypothetical protein
MENLCERCRLKQQLAMAHSPNPKWERVRKALAELYEEYCAAYVKPQVDTSIESALEQLMHAYDEWLD